MTRKVNQDVVENMFSFIKGICGAALNNITPLQFKYAYITICFILYLHTYNIKKHKILFKFYFLVSGGTFWENIQPQYTLRTEIQKMA